MASASLLIKPAAGGIVHEGAGLHSGPAMGQEITQHQQEGFGGGGGVGGVVVRLCTDEVL